MSPDRDQLIGEIINNFEIQEIIGRGGMGIVYRAYHPDLQRFAAVKVMRPELASQSGFYERFLQEARTAARMEHPNIVDVINFGRYENSYYLMMDYIQGPSLRDLILENKEGLPLWDAVQIFWQIADVLVYSHKSGVLHRDLKPDNILLTHSIRPNRPYRAVVTDFGLVKLVQNSLLETQEGISVGTPAYMSPEQCRGEELDGRTDIYALGVMLYEAVTGRRPYPIRGLFDAAKFHASGKLIAPRAMNAAIPLKLDLLIRRMLNTNPAKRLGTAGEGVSILGELIEALSSKEEGQKPDSQLQERITKEEQRPIPLSPVPDSSSTPAATVSSPVVADEQYFIQIAYQDQWEEKMHALGQDSLVVGRLASSDIALDRPERYISKRHCEIKLEDGRVLIRDLGSTNGTILNDERLQAQVFHEWAPGDEIHLGPFKMALRTAAELADVPSPPVKSKSTMPTTKVHFQFMLHCPDANPTDLPLTSERPVTVGRAAECELVIDHPHVSKHHCRIQLGNDGAEIVDLRSTNGTFLRGQRLPAHVPVLWKDEPTITLGPFTITLEAQST